MATLDATVGGAASNSYVTVAEADDYFASRLNTGNWAAADKDAALITAAYDIDSFFKWIGARTDDIQFMDWPRIFVDDVESNEIPFDIKRAQMELAISYIDGGYSNTQAETVEKVKLGGLEVEFGEGSYDKRLPSYIANIVGILGQYIESSPNGIKMAALSR